MSLYLATACDSGVDSTLSRSIATFCPDDARLYAAPLLSPKTDLGSKLLRCFFATLVLSCRARDTGPLTLLLTSGRPMIVLFEH